MDGCEVDLGDDEKYPTWAVCRYGLSLMTILTIASILSCTYLGTESGFVQLPIATALYGY